MKISYLVRETGRTIARSRGQFLLAGAVQTVCLLLLSIFVVITFNVLALLSAAGRRAELYAFLTTEAAAGPDGLLARVAAIDGITAVRLVFSDEALAELRADLAGDSLLLAALDANPLPPSLRVSVAAEAASPAAVADIERKLALMPGVSEVWSGKEVLAQLHRAMRTVLIADVLVLVIVSLSVVFIVFQTVEGAIAARRQEIEIMSLVGATRAAVRFPFLLQGGLQGLAGGAFAFAGLLLLHRIVTTTIPAPIFPALALVAANLGLGFVLGLTGSALALSRLAEAPPAPPRGRAASARPGK